jgi:nitrilase
LSIFSRFALEGRSWVVSTSGLIGPDDFAHLNVKEFPMRDIMMPCENNLQNGGSMIVDPRDNVVSGPLIDEEGIIYGDVDPLLAVEERQSLDISGHYSRFDIFNKPLK